MTVDDPNVAQRLAADPVASAWVAASAGTGKTKVLTDRVLTLMLAGTPPQKILCLTFTRAAAAEMATRIAERLGDWTRLADGDLDEDLRKLLDRAPQAPERVRARRLFARVLDVPGGTRIETIHAFCQSLLRRFPLEAGLAPHYAVLDDRGAAELLAEAREDVLAGGEPELSVALSILTERVHETRFPELMAGLARERSRLRRLLDRHGGSVESAAAEVRARLGVAAEETPVALVADACRDVALDLFGLRRAVDLLSAGSKTDRERGAAVAAWLDRNLEGRTAGFDAYARLFLVKENAVDLKQPRKTLITAGAAKPDPSVLDVLGAEAARLLAVVERRRSLDVAGSTEALLQVGGALLDAYETHKRRRAQLDYDDLIFRARDLLRRPGVAPWVLFKLDGGLDHILIDEAQDTNPEQWDVVAALAEEFFAGEGARDPEPPRTVFAVGDAKQSIYSFQRADPQGFERMRRHFADRVARAGQTWRPVDMTVSFRSCRAVLSAVDAVFAADGARDGVAPSRKAS